MNDAAPIAAASAVPVYAPGPAPAAAGGKVGVLLVNLGTPDGADAASVRRYLKEFLSDPRVIENQGVIWQLVLNGVILPIRPRRKARDYAEDLESREERIPAQDHHPLAGGKARPHARSAGAEPHGRLGDALRQSLDRVAARRSRGARLRAHPRHPALSAILRGDDSDGGRRGVSRARSACASSRRCASRRPTTTTPPISRRWRPRPAPRSRGSISSRTSSSPRSTACPRPMSTRAIPITPSAWRPCGCCAPRSSSTRPSWCCRSSRASAARNGSSPRPTRPSSGWPKRA